MKKLLAFILAAALHALPSAAQVTLDRCLALADSNYPVIRKYGLVAKTRDLNLADINKGWLPKVCVYGQVSLQNTVPEFPEALMGMLSSYGQDFDGMGHVQYKAGIDLNQKIWDGGAAKSQREIERAGATVSSATIDVQMYAMHEKVQSLFFGILLLDEQIEQTQATLHLLEANKERLASMLAHGTAMQSDVDMIEAQVLTVRQQLAEARSASDGYRRMLELYIGEPLSGRTLERPSGDMPAAMTSERPELQMFHAQALRNNARLRAVDATVMPKVGLFAQAYYGYPGLNYFESMRDRDMSFNAVAGIKVSWDIDSFYFKRDMKRRIAVDNAGIEAERALFLFNTDVQVSSRQSSIDGLRQVISEDSRIVCLRGRVRKAAESQLANGIIDTADLLGKITDENQAQLNAHYHEIQLLQNIYQLKYTLNR